MQLYDSNRLNISFISSKSSQLTLPMQTQQLKSKRSDQQFDLYFLFGFVFSDILVFL